MRQGVKPAKEKKRVRKREKESSSIRNHHSESPLLLLLPRSPPSSNNPRPSSLPTRAPRPTPSPTNRRSRELVPESKTICPAPIENYFFVHPRCCADASVSPPDVGFPGGRPGDGGESMTPAHLRVVLLGSRHGGAGWARGQFHRPLGRRIGVGRGDRVSGRGRAKGKTEGQRKEVGGEGRGGDRSCCCSLFPSFSLSLSLSWPLASVARRSGKYARISVLHAFIFDGPHRPRVLRRGGGLGK